MITSYSVENPNSPIVHTFECFLDAVMEVSVILPGRKKQNRFLWHLTSADVGH